MRNHETPRRSHWLVTRSKRRCNRRRSEREETAHVQREDVQEDGFAIATHRETGTISICSDPGSTNVRRRLGVQFFSGGRLGVVLLCQGAATWKKGRWMLEAAQWNTQFCKSKTLAVWARDKGIGTLKDAQKCKQGPDGEELGAENGRQNLWRSRTLQITQTMRVEVVLGKGRAVLEQRENGRQSNRAQPAQQDLIVDLVVSTGDATEHQAPSVRVVQQPWTHESTIMDLHDPHALLIFRILCGLLAVDVLYTLAIFIYTMIGTDPVDDSQKFDPAVPFLLPILSGRGLAFLLLGGTILVCISGYIGGKQVRTNLLVFAFFACIALIIVSAVDAFSLETLVKVAVFFLCIYLRRILIKRAEMYGITLARIVRAPRRLTRPPCAPFVTVVVPERQLDSEEGV